MRRCTSFRALRVLLFALASVLPLFCQRVFDLAASDGTKLKASYFAASKPGPGVLLLHQCNRQRKVWDGLAQQLSAAGINVLTFDYRGFGESGGDPWASLPQEKAAQIQAEKWPGDIDTAFRYLKSQHAVAQEVVGVGGASCGVQNTVQTAKRHPEVKSLVLLSGNADLSGRQYLRNPASPPVFFAVADDDDEFRPSIAAIEWLYALATNPGKKFVHLSTGGHGADMFPVHPELMGMIVDWYVTTLIKTPGRAPAQKDAPAVPQDMASLNLIDQPGGAAKVAEQLEATRQHDPKATLFSEAIINLIGYEHLQAGDTKDAIEILKLNATAFPNSPNVYDSLSDAYLADGQKDLARQNAEKVLQMLPSDTTDDEKQRTAIKESAEQKLKQLPGK